jgi:DNA-binding XRE family transcriptional regulator
MHGGQLIKTMRITREYNQDELAEMIGIGTRTLQRWESKQSEPRWSDVVSVASLLNCDLWGLDAIN